MKFLIMFFLIAFPLFGVTPALIPVQGILTENSGTPINGNISLTMSLYDSQTSTDELWREERENFPVENGYISLYLGEITELSPSIILNTNQLWLEIVFNNERIPRIRLASVPYALEAINVQRAEQIGDITDTQISNMFNSTCATGYYIQGYDGDGNPICAEDKVEAGDTNVVYNAGYGISIDDNNISVSENLYTGENGIALENHVISIDYTKVSGVLHNHDDIYYKKTDNAQNNYLVKYSQDGITSSDILEVDGNVNMENLFIDSKGIFSVLNLTTLKTDKIKGILNGNELEIIAFPITVKEDIVSNNDINLEGEVNVEGKLITNKIIANNELTVSNIKFKVGNSIKLVMSKFEVMNNTSSVDVDSYYILNNGSIDATDDDDSNPALTKDNAVCSISMNYIRLSNGTTDYNKCEVYLNSHDKWKINVSNENGNWADAVCKARCLKWN